MLKKEKARPLISVVVCTYNRADLLNEVLQTLCDQTLDSAWYEVVVVDNNSQDSTRTLVEILCQNYSNIRYYFEETQGLSHARNRGWQEARGIYVIYIDDDCKVPSHWLSVAKEVIENISPAVFGGPFYAFYKSAKPKWYFDRYGSHEPFTRAHILDRKECIQIFGGNMAFKREILEKVGGFDPKLGMTGRQIAYGEETVTLQRIAESLPDQSLYFEPRFYLYHLVAARKMTMGWNIRAAFSHGRSSLYVFNLVDKEYTGRRYFLAQFAKVSGALVIDLLRGMFGRNRSLYPFMQNYLYEHTSKQVGKLGLLFENYRYALRRNSQVPLKK